MLTGTEIDKAFQEYRRLWALTEERKILTPVPLHLDIELTNVCNLKCKMCWQSEFLSYPKGYMEYDQYTKIIDEAVRAGVKAIKLQSRGEAMLHPRIIDAIRYAKEHGILDVQITTNATLLTEDTWQRLLESGLDMLNFSLDTSHKDSFAELNKEVPYSDVIKNVKGFLEMRKKMTAKKPYVKIQVARSDSPDGIAIRRQVDAIASLADKIMENPVFILHEDQAERSSAAQASPCRMLWQRMVINYDGIVTPCCRDYNCLNEMGNINRDSLESIWLGKAFSNMRELHVKGMRSKIPVCDTCEIS